MDMQADYGDHPINGDGNGGGIEKLVELGRAVSAAQDKQITSEAAVIVVEPEPTGGHWFINDLVSIQDVEKGAFKSAAHLDKPVQVHYHPDGANMASDRWVRLGCNDQCHVVQPDQSWPGGVGGVDRIGTIRRMVLGE